MRPGLGEDIRAFLYALGLHVLCALLAFSGMFWWQSAKPEAAAGDPIEAVFVDLGSLQPLPDPERPVRPPPQRQSPPPPLAPPATDLSARDLIEQPRIDRQALLRAEEEAREQEERRRRAEQVLLEEEQQRREEEQRQERERQAQEQAERERAEQERIQREQAEEAAREQAEREAAEAAAQAEREAQASQPGAGGSDDSLTARYAAAIQARVNSHWLRPDHVRPGIRCAVRITQIPGGEVTSVNVVEPCNADELTRRTIEAAVLRAQPLPYQGYEAVFARSIRFNFRYDGGQ